MSTQLRAVSVAETLKDSYKSIRSIFGSYIKEGDLTLLFGDSNCGKSALACDIAMAVAYGTNHFGNEIETKVRGKVLIFDLENNDSQFYSRYANSPMASDTSDMIKRVCSVDITDVDAFTGELVKMLDEYEPVLVVFDNITKVETKLRVPLMERFKCILKSYETSFLVISHTIKRKLEKPIDQNDIRGSKNVIDFVDAAFGIGLCADKVSKYIKHVKSRSCEKIVEVAKVKLETAPYLHFEFMEWADENDLLKCMGDSRSKEIFGPKDLHKAVMLKREGHSIREISDKLGKSKSTVQRKLAEYEEKNSTESDNSKRKKSKEVMTESI